MIVKASVWSIAGSLIEKVLMLATYVIVTRQVDKVQFGLLVLVLLFTELLAYIAGIGIGENIIRTKTLSDDFMTSNKWFNRLVAAGLTGVMLLLLTPAAYYFHSAELAKLTLIKAFYPALPALASFFMAIMRRDMRFKELAIRTALISLLSGLTGILLALAGAGVYALIAAKNAYSFADWWALKKLSKLTRSAKSIASTCVKSGTWARNCPLHRFLTTQARVFTSCLSLRCLDQFTWRCSMSVESSS